MLNLLFFWARRIRFFLGENYSNKNHPINFNCAVNEIYNLLKFFYLFLSFWAYSSANALLATGIKIPTDPLWPIELIGKNTLTGNGVATMVSVFIIMTSAFIAPGSRLLRILAFCCLFLFAAFENSFGSISHSLHFLIFVSFFVIFLPKNIGDPAQRTRKQTMRAVSIFWLIQSVLLFSYTLAGTLKVVSTGADLFTSDGLVRTILTRAIPNGGSPFTIEKIVTEHESIIQLFYIGNIYIQLISVFVLFRPSLHKIYGIALISFHFGTFLLLQIKFTPHIIIWGLFFVMSPFAPKEFSLLSVLRALPVFGWFFKIGEVKVLKRNIENEKAFLIYDGECPFCSRYTQLLNVKDKIGDLQLINAREGGELVEKIQAIPFNINEGMVLVYGDNYYFGSDALHVLSLLSSDKGFFSKINKLMFSTPLIAKLSYPILRFGRNMSLKFLGIKKI